MSVNQSRARLCAACGAPLIGDNLGGLCPKCLLLVGVAAEPGTHLHIHCPHCRVAIELVDDPSVHEVTCPSCDSRFSLIGSRDPTVAAEHGGKVGRFELIERVGIGTFGSVWRARDPQLDRTVAVKLPRKEQLLPEEAEQFLREARAAGQLTHPGIVAVHEVGRDGDRIYIVSDYILGVTLADSLSARRPSIRQAAELCQLVAEALHHAHQHGVIHRDLKPSNIMLDQNGRPHVMDFGLAKREAAEITMTVEGRILGTPAYMSPEQARGEAHRADARSDVYSLGVIIYELLTGEKPFRGTSQMLLQQVLKEEAPSPRKLNGTVPRELETICLRCLEKDPDRRFPSALELAEDLGRFLQGEPIRSCPISQRQRWWRWCRRNPVTSSLALGIVVSLLIGLAATFWQWRMATGNFVAAAKAQAAAEQSQAETRVALSESESRLARVFVERGIQKIDVDPHAGLPWLIEALRTEPESSPVREMHRLRIGLLLRELPAIVGFWPKAVDAEFSSDGSKVAIAAGNDALVFRLPGFDAVPPMVHSQPVVSVTFSPQGDRLATICRADGSPPLCRIWESGTGQPATESVDLTNREYNLRDTPTIHFTPDGQRLVAVYAGLYNRWHSKMSTRVFDSRTMVQSGKTFAHHSDLDYTAGYHELSPDVTRVLVPRGASAGDQRIPWDEDDFPDDTNRPQQYDLVTAEPVHPPLDHVLDFYGRPQYNEDGTQIATSEDGKIKLWDARDGSLITEFSLSPEVKYAQIRFHPDAKSIFIIEPRKAMWRDIQTGELIREWSHEDKFLIDPTACFVVRRDPNGEHYVSQLLPGDADEDEHPLPQVYSVSFCPDGSRFILNPSGHYEAGMYVSPPEQVFRTSDGQPLSPPWRFSSGKLRQPFSRTGRYFLCRLNEGIWLWDLDRRERIHENFPPGRNAPIIDAASSDDRRRIVLLSKDGNLSSWTSETGQSLTDPFTIPPPSAADNESEWKYVSLDRDSSAVAVVGEYREPIPENANRDVSVVQVWNLTTGKALFDPIVFNQHARSWIDLPLFLPRGDTLVIPEHVHLERQRQPGDPPLQIVTRLHFVSVATGVPLREPLEMEHTAYILDIRAGQERCLIMRESDDWFDSRRQSPFAPHVQMLSTKTWQPLTPRMIPVKDTAWNAKLTPDRTRLVLGNGEVWNATTGERIVPAVLSHRDADEIVISDDGQSFITVTDVSDFADRTTEIRLHSLNGTSLSPPMINTRTGEAHCAIHPTTGMVAAAGHHLRLWDTTRGISLSAAITVNLPGTIGRYQNLHRSVFFTPSGDRLYIEDRGQLVLVPWGDIVSSIPSDDVLNAWSGILSGQWIDHSGGTVPLEPDGFQRAWEVIRASRDGKE